MAYGSNILKNEAAYYTLQNASIINGILHISAGGFAVTTIDVTALPAMTSNMLFSAILTDYSNNYSPNIRVIISAKETSSDEWHEIIIYPNSLNEDIFECEFEIFSGEYSDMTVRIEASKNTSFMLWELRPEASDESAQVEIEGVKQALSKLLYDYNTVEFTGSIYETTIALITCKLLQNTDVQGHFLFTFNTTQKCTLTLRFYDNEAEELFSPLFYDLYPGHNSIGVPHAFLHRLAGNHSFFVTAQVNYGTFTVPVRGALFTIDAGYLATREIDLAMDVYDISIRQLKADNGPNEIWAVGIESDILYVQYRPYKETNTNVGWTSVGSLGVSRGAAIEFDGNWVLRTNADQYTIETDEEPYIFNIDDNNNLYAYYGINDTEPILLDTNVSMVKACKGYSSIVYPDQDQGLIVAYIKNNIAYYRRYYYNSVVGKKLWEDAQAFSGNWDAIDVHRLNDYRASFTLSNAAENLWKYTDRTYVGQAAYPEKTSVDGIIQEEGMHIQLFGYYSIEQIDPPIAIASVGYEDLGPDEQGKNHVKWVLTVDHPLWMTQRYNKYADLIQCQGVENIKNIEWTVLYDKTRIIITSEMPLKNIYYRFTIMHNNFLRYRHNDLIYALKSSLMIELDKRIYINTQHEYPANIKGQQSFTIRFRGKETQYFNASDSSNIIGVLNNPTEQYYQIVRNYKSPIEEASAKGIQMTQIAYYDVKDAPV